MNRCFAERDRFEPFIRRIMTIIAVNVWLMFLYFNCVGWVLAVFGLPTLGPWLLVVDRWNEVDVVFGGEIKASVKNLSIFIWWKKYRVEWSVEVSSQLGKKPSHEWVRDVADEDLLLRPVLVHFVCWTLLSFWTCWLFRTALHSNDLRVVLLFDRVELPHDFVWYSSSPTSSFHFY